MAGEDEVTSAAAAIGAVACEAKTLSECVEFDSLVCGSRDAASGTSTILGELEVADTLSASALR
jgi:hypothetical protein